MTKLQRRGGEGKFYFPLFKLAKRQRDSMRQIALSMLPIASRGIMHGSQGITGESMFTKGFAKTGGISEDIQRTFSSGN